MIQYAARLILLTGVVALPAGAQTMGDGAGDRPMHPGILAQRCILHIRMVTERTSREMHMRANHAVRAINFHIEAGNTEEAEVAAMRGRDALNRIAGRGTMSIENSSERCVMILTEREAPQEAIDRVHAAAGEGTSRIAERLAAELARIDEALEGGE